MHKRRVAIYVCRRSTAELELCFSYHSQWASTRREQSCETVEEETNQKVFLGHDVNFKLHYVSSWVCLCFSQYSVGSFTEMSKDKNFLKSRCGREIVVDAIPTLSGCMYDAPVSPVLKFRIISVSKKHCYLGF